jgi:hypothetical protein
LFQAVTRFVRNSGSQRGWILKLCAATYSRAWADRDRHKLRTPKESCLAVFFIFISRDVFVAINKR